MTLSIGAGSSEFYQRFLPLNAENGRLGSTVSSGQPPRDQGFQNQTDAIVVQDEPLEARQRSRQTSDSERQSNQEQQDQSGAVAQVPGRLNVDPLLARDFADPFSGQTNRANSPPINQGFAAATFSFFSEVPFPNLQGTELDLVA